MSQEGGVGVSGVARVEPATAVVSFSFIVPVHNDADDFRVAVTGVEAARRPRSPCEIVAIDDASTDGTLAVLRRYSRERRIRLVEQPARRGSAAARNRGLEIATGDVAVFMDADNVVPRDFLERLRLHYLDGADFVTIESRVVNQAGVVGRFQQAFHERDYGGLKNVGYSQSFSCRRELALAVRFNEELSGADDVDFFRRLPLERSRWVRDPTIVVGHILPDTPKAFWRQQVWRGEAALIGRLVIHRPSLLRLTLRKSAVLCWSALLGILIVPGLVAAAKLSGYSSRARSDLLSFYLLWALRGIAHRFGEWRTLAHLWRDRIA